jgi:hypothetical protein
MLFPGGHWSQDWELLAKIAAEWAEIRKLFGLGSKATREQIEKCWDGIFNVDRARWPAIRRIHNELMADPALARHLRTCYWQELKPRERKGYEFQEVLGAVLTRLFWQVVRNSHRWHRFQGALKHWAVFWNTPNLAEELRRAIDDMEESEGSRGAQLPDDPTDGRTPQNREPEYDFQGRRAECSSPVLQEMLECCRCAEERALIQDWYQNGGEYTEAEEEAIARRHGFTCARLNAILRRILHEIESDHKRRRPNR